MDQAHGSSRLRSITARSCEAEPAMGKGPVGDGVGSRGDGPQLPEPRPEDTHGPTETHVPREACHRLRAGVLPGGRPCGPLCWADTQSSPRGEGVSTDGAGRHCHSGWWGCWGPSRHPSSWTPTHTWASRRTAVRPAGRTPLCTTAWPQVWLRPPGPWLSTQLPTEETGLRRAAKASLPVRAAPS